MENVQENNENVGNIKPGEIIKPLQLQQQQQLVAEETENLQQHTQQQEQEEPQQQLQLQLQQQKQQQQEVDLAKQNETPDVKSVETSSAPLPTLNENYEVEEDDDDDDDDDDEEKETSQKLIIDIPDDEEEEKEEEDEDDDDDVIALDDMPPAEEVLPAKEDINQKNAAKAENVEAIITLSDGEEDIPASEATFKPGKVQKRRSAGAGTRAGDDEEHFRLKRRKINVAGAPKMPLTGYLRYSHDRRESLRKEHPSKTAMEHTKMIGEEWHSLPADVKANYLKAADADKQRYVKELHTFLKSRPDILASELAKNKTKNKTAENNSPNPSTTVAATTTTATGTTATKQVLKEKSQTNDNSKCIKDTAAAAAATKDKSSAKELTPTPSTSQQALDNHKTTVQEQNKRKRTPTPPTTTNTNASTSNAAASTTIVTPAPGEIPIFTNEFLEHNKVYDMELRSLRKSKTDLEQQNSVLEKHVENMKFGVEKMITENNELEEKNRLLEIYLDKLKRKLALALASLPLPSAPNGATVDNIDKYMQDLYKMSTSNSHGPATLNKAKDIIRKLDLQIQL